jgi:leucyl-tRNA synthetase
MIFTNTLIAAASDPDVTISKQLIETLVLLVSPFAPHMAEECWSKMGHSKTLAYHPWPQYEEQYCVETMATIAVQVNGKVRGKIEVEIDLEQEAVLGVARENQNVLKFIENKALKKVIYVPGRILNILV